mmetsp:Transcript_22158/g.68050  ORF Transcript_22158/g.68050 Transcript_22158/m.68050 type:complete len:368 (+) Transcript_22158:1296-2399(+)
MTKSAAPAFSMPVPGVNGAVAGALRGQTCVLTGVFPEVGGGAGLSQGKDRVKAMVTTFGGRCTASVSGKTTILVVGREPGFSKVSKARGQLSIKILSLHDLVRVIHGNALDAAEPLVIESFSAGYASRRNPYGNSLALTASQTELDIARGLGPTMIEAAPQPKPKRRPKPTKKAKRAKAAPKENAAPQNAIASLKVAQLREQLQSHGLPMYGRKADLVRRLAAFLAKSALTQGQGDGHHPTPMAMAIDENVAPQVAAPQLQNKFTPQETQQHIVAMQSRENSLASLKVAELKVLTLSLSLSLNLSLSRSLTLTSGKARRVWPFEIRPQGEACRAAGGPSRPIGLGLGSGSGLGPGSGSGSGLGSGLG